MLYSSDQELMRVRAMMAGVNATDAKNIMRWAMEDPTTLKHRIVSSFLGEINDYRHDIRDIYLVHGPKSKQYKNAWNRGNSKGGKLLRMLAMAGHIASGDLTQARFDLWLRNR